MWCESNWPLVLSTDKQRSHVGNIFKKTSLGSVTTQDLTPLSVDFSPFKLLWEKLDSKFAQKNRVATYVNCLGGKNNDRGPRKTLTRRMSRCCTALIKEDAILMNRHCSGKNINIEPASVFAILCVL